MTYKVARTSIGPDPHIGSVTLLLSGDGANNSTDIRDSSRTPKVITAFGDAKISTAQSKWNGSSLAFDGTGDYLSTAYTTANYEWWTTDFTVEAWVYATSWAGWGLPTLDKQPALIGNNSPTTGAGYWFFGPDVDGKVRFAYWNGSVVSLVVSTTSLPTSQWNHIAMTNTSAGITLFVNGTAQTLTARVGTPQQSTGLGLVVGAFNNVYITGYVDDLRITKGVARYTANFTPPTQPFPNF